jgi:hypothetical protein
MAGPAGRAAAEGVDGRVGPLPNALEERLGKAGLRGASAAMEPLDRAFGLGKRLSRLRRVARGRECCPDANERPGVIGIQLQRHPEAPDRRQGLARQQIGKAKPVVAFIANSRA